MNNMKPEKYNIITLLIYIFLFIGTIFYPHYLSKIGKNYPYISYFAVLALIVSGTYYIYKKSFNLFVNIIFFVIFYLSYPIMKLQMEELKISFPGINFLFPIFIYLLVIFFVKSFKNEISWFRSGNIDRVSWILILVMIVISSIALISWSVLIKPDLSQFKTLFQENHPALLFLGGIGFALSNAFVEELIFRGFFYEGLKTLISKTSYVIIIQALLFGLLHINGFPSGVLGVSLVFVWGIFLGAIRYRSQGLFGCILSHIFADMTIFMILFFMLR